MKVTHSACLPLAASARQLCNKSAGSTLSAAASLQMFSSEMLRLPVSTSPTYDRAMSALYLTARNKRRLRKIEGNRYD